MVATKNLKKLEEIRQIWKGCGLTITSLADYASTPRIIENKKTFRENAIKKAITIARFTRKLTLGEDSGLCVDALGGKPGVYSSRFSGKNKSDAQNNAKLLKMLQGVAMQKRKAYYACAVALADEYGLVGVVEGRCYGRIALELKGSAGFGYDPLFLIPRYHKTFGQLGDRIKHTMSHRCLALRKAKVILEKYIERKKRS